MVLYYYRIVPRCQVPHSAKKGKKDFLMKRIERLLFESSAYCSLIVFLFLLFTATESDSFGGMKLGTFALIFAFGILISLAGAILRIKSIKLIYRLVIHYFTLFAAFCVVFMISGNLFITSPASIFSAIAIFTFLYAAVFGASILMKHAVSALEKPVDKAVKKKQMSNKKKAEEKAYKPLYK